MTHPEISHLAAFLDGSLPEALSQEVESHLEDCPLCEETLVELEESKHTLAAIIQDAARKPSTPASDRRKRRRSPPSGSDASLTDTMDGSSPADDDGVVAPRLSRGSSKAPASSDEQWTNLTISQFLEQRGLVAGVEIDSLSWDTPEASGAGAVSDHVRDNQESKYRVGEVIAEGGMGAVLDANDVCLRRRVAMKVIRDNDAAHDKIVRFVEEAQITGQLEHPSIVPVHELGVNANGDVFYTMKFIDGESLKQILKRIEAGDDATEDSYPLSRLLDLFSRVCDAMEFAHSKKVIHRDLKPDNIMSGKYGEVLVVDWGLAKVIRPELGASDQETDAVDMEVSRWIETDRDRHDSGEFTMDGTVLGTPAFMSPEQASGRLKEVDHRTDIYALGAVLYNILTLRPPVAADNLTELLGKVRSGEIAPPDPAITRGRAIPDAMLYVARKALSKDPKDRYQSVSELSSEINAFRGGYATAAENAGIARQIRLLATRNQGITWSVCIATMLLLAGSVFYVRNLAAEKTRADLAAKQAVAAAAKATASEQVAVREKAAAELALGKSQTSLAEAAFLNKNRKEMGRYLEQCPPIARDTHWNYLDTHTDEANWTLIANAKRQTCYRGLAADPRDSATSGSGVVRFYLCDGLGLLRCIDGKTGEVLREKQTPFRECRMAISHDGTRLAFSTRSNSPRLFVVSTDDFSTIATHSIPHSKGCKAVAFTMDPNLVVRSNFHESVLVDIDKGTTSVVSDGYISCCHPQKMEAFGIKDGHMVCVDLKEAKVNRVYRGDHRETANVSINMNGNLICAAGKMGDFLVYRTDKPEPMKTIAAYKVDLMELRFSRHSDRLVTYGIDLRGGILRFWNPLSGQRVPIREYFTRGDRIGSLLAWNESADLVASGLGAMEAFTTPDFCKRIRHGGGSPKFVDESTIGHLVWGNSPGLSFYDLDGVQQTHKLPSGSVIRSRSRTMAIAGHLGFSDHDPQQTYPFVVEHGELVVGNSTMPPIQIRSQYDAAAISDDGRFAAFAGTRHLQIFKRDSDNPSAPWQSIATVPDSEFAFHLPPKSSHLFFPNTVRPSLFLSVLTHEDGAGRMMLESFDLESGKRLLEKIHLAEGTAFEIHPSGDRILCGCTDGTIRGFDPASLEETFVTRVHDRSVAGIAIRPDGRVVATTGQRGVVRFWELVDSGIGKLIRESACDRGRIDGMDFSPSGDELVCSAGGEISTLDLNDILREINFDAVAPADIAQAVPEMPKSMPPKPASSKPVPSDESLESSLSTSVPNRDASASGLEIAARLKSDKWQWSKPVELEFDSDIDSGDHLDPVISRDGRHLSVSLWNGDRMLDVQRFDFADSRSQKLTGGTWLSGGVNSSRRDHTSSPLTQDGAMIFTSDRSGSVGKKDLWACSSKPPFIHFSKATPLPEPINSVHNDVDACLTADGLGIVFGSDRPAPTAQNNAGQPEIWWASRIAITDDFSTPRIVGMVRNQDGDQDDGETASVNTPCISSDGLLLIYAANQNDGTKDLYYRVRKNTDDDFGKRTRLSQVIQSPKSDMMPSLSSDGRTLIFGSRQGVGNKIRLFVAHLEEKTQTEP